VPTIYHHPMEPAIVCIVGVSLRGSRRHAISRGAGS
jgi:hypothetical protein